MADSQDEERSPDDQHAEPTPALNHEVAEEKVIPMNREYETDTSAQEDGPRGAALAAVSQAKVRLEDGREEVAGRLERVADGLRERSAGNAGGPAIERVAKSMESTAGYLHEHKTAAIADDLSSYAKLHPTSTVIIAALIGFLLGRLLK